MQPFKTNVIRKRNPRSSFISDADCDALKEDFREDDVRGDLSSMTAIWPQFAFAHQAYDSVVVDGVAMNRYGFFDNGDGVYPEAGTADILFDDAGQFRMSGPDKLMEVSWQVDGETKTAQIAADRNRVNENRGLTALHVLVQNFHNKRFRIHGSYAQARAENIAVMNRSSLAACSDFTGIGRSEIMNAVVVRDMHKAIEFNFQHSRVLHAAMPETIADHHLFDRSVTLTPQHLLDEKARKVNLGTSPAMRNMGMRSGSSSIVERTVSRHNELNLATTADLAAMYRMPSPDADIDVAATNIWYGLLYESDKRGDGRLGPLGARSYADGVAGTLSKCLDQAWGLSYPLWQGAPETPAELVDYVYG